MVYMIGPYEEKIMNSTQYSIVPFDPADVVDDSQRDSWVYSYEEGEQEDD
jgi:hypothetical protein